MQTTNSRKRTRKFALSALVAILFAVSLACQAITGPPSTPVNTPEYQVAPTGTPGEKATTIPQEATPRSTDTGEAAPGTQAAATQAANTDGTSNDRALLPNVSIDPAQLAEMNSYTITVSVQFNAQTFSGSQQVAYTNSEDTALSSLFFRLLPNGAASYGDGSMAVSQALYNGQAVDTALSVNNSALEVKLPQPIQPGERALLQMDFSGVVPSDFGQTGYGIYNFTDDVLSLADWYPILAVYDENGWNLDPVSGEGDSVYADAALYSVDVTVDQPLTVIGSGVATPEGQPDSGTHALFDSGPAREFYMIMSPDYQPVSQMVDGIKVNSYFLRRHDQAGAAALQIAVDAVKIYNQKFGQYPYTELDVVDAPMIYAAGVEYPGVVMILDDLYATGSDNAFFPVVVAHEVAHQWWYNTVGNDVFDNPWMDEALATYSSSLYFESTGGESAYMNDIQGYQYQYERAVQEGQDDLVTNSLSHFESHQGGDYSAVVYTKGALFFYNVRQAIGDEAFFKALHDYYQANFFRIATPDDLLNAFEQASGKQLDDLYQEWLYSKQSP